MCSDDIVLNVFVEVIDVIWRVIDVFVVNLCINLLVLLTNFKNKARKKRALILLWLYCKIGEAKLCSRRKSIQHDTCLMWNSRHRFGDTLSIGSAEIFWWWLCSELCCGLLRSLQWSVLIDADKNNASFSRLRALTLLYCSHRSVHCSVCVCERGKLNENFALKVKEISVFLLRCARCDDLQYIYGGEYSANRTFEGGWRGSELGRRKYYHEYKSSEWHSRPLGRGERGGGLWSWSGWVGEKSSWGSQ